MSNIAFQLPVQVKPDSPAVLKKESPNDLTNSPFNRVLDQTMSSKRNTSGADEKQAEIKTVSDDSETIMNQSIANSLLFTVMATQPVALPFDTQSTATSDYLSAKVQLTGVLQTIAKQDAVIPIAAEVQHNSAATELSVMMQEPTPVMADPNLLVASAKGLVGAEGQALFAKPTVNTKLETHPAMLSQTDLQSKLDDVISTTADPFRLDVSAPQQLDLSKHPLEEAPLNLVPMSTQAKQQSPSIVIDELPVANQSAMPTVKQEQLVAKQPIGTEESSFIMPIQAQSVTSQPGQDDKDSLSQDDSLINHGLTALRAGKSDELVFETTQQQAIMPNQQDIISQIVDRAKLYLRPANQSEMVLQLKPEHLGELTLKVSVDSGIVSAAFHSNNPEVRQVIEASLPQLKQDLSQQGIKLDSVSVFSGSEQFFDNGQRPAQQQQTVPLRKNRRELLQAIESAEEVSVKSTDGVDYRI